MDSTSTRDKRLFILDTNVLVHDPLALFNFHEHDIYLPMVVLEELDNGKKGLSETARNIRQTNRILDSLLGKASHTDLLHGLPLTPPDWHPKESDAPKGRLFFQTEEISMVLPSTLPGNKPDNSILASALSLQARHSDKLIILVSKDINLRIKASILGIRAEDYYNDKSLDDLRFMHSGIVTLSDDFWETHGKNLSSWQEGGKTFYKLANPDPEWGANLFLSSEGNNPFDAIIRKTDDQFAHIESLKDYQKPRNQVFGVSARNREQSFALNILMDPSIDFVTLLGLAGTGKTLLTLAAALQQTLEQDRYREIIVTRITVPLGEDIGFLPGTEEEKMTPWMGAFIDNLEVLTQAQGAPWVNMTPEELQKYRIRIRSMNFMRGRTFLNKFIIIDEAQNLTSKQMQALITRAGPGTKVVCLGNIAQIDTPYLTETTSGLTYVVQRFKNWPHSAHIVLTRGERSRLADHASHVL